ncbi:hypothetical protein C1Y11_25305 [Pseudomonas sp. FW305-20]|nr:hypothetical protein C1Y11_25305 [Pseudomonas sp. FW305-20]PMU21231.1 hypothetical protein C1Y10_04635 [Pseudomonas sp. FW305-122]PMU41235.1 hypothetical protein C1Y12_08960 [Pseudomonas sp. FW305-47B]PMX64177.1 hypothetical protein C1Y13_05320 [Pseudomonas sp. FW305-33]PMX70706.1 hypothetical protein C1X12_03320 [Pseudomonas sp. FW305-60]
MRLRNWFQTTLVLERHDGYAILQSASNTVGASLLAIAVCQSTSISTDTPLSRAGSLPQRKAKGRLAVMPSGLEKC